MTRRMLPLPAGRFHQHSSASFPAASKAQAVIDAPVLPVIRGLLDRVQQLTAAHTDALASHARPGPGRAQTARRARGSAVNGSPSSATVGPDLLHRPATSIVASRAW
jgi:hypothetical protein